jgi:hypothetical protein
MGSPTGFLRNPSPIQQQPYSGVPQGIGGAPGPTGISGSGGITPPGVTSPMSSYGPIPQVSATHGQSNIMQALPSSSAAMPINNLQSRYSQPAIQPQQPFNSGMMGNALGRFAGRY